MKGVRSSLLAFEYAGDFPTGEGAGQWEKQRSKGVIRGVGEVPADWKRSCQLARSIVVRRSILLRQVRACDVAASSAAAKEASPRFRNEQ